MPLARSSLRLAPLLAAAAIGLDACRGASALDASARRDGEHVVLLHGLGRSGWSMRVLERSLAEAGYAVHNLDYPSRRAPPEEIVAGLHDELASCCAAAERLHFVTHSLGGILARAYIAEHDPENLGRVVMLAPPNHGSAFVDVAERWRLAALLGPTGSQLGTGPASLPNRLPPPDFELGVIAGHGGFNPLGNRVLAGDNDGTVSVASTQLQGMRDFARLSVSHTFIMRDARAVEQVLVFLRHGRFALDAGDS